MRLSINLVTNIWRNRRFTDLIGKYMHIKTEIPLFLWLLFLCQKQSADNGWPIMLDFE
jgi:hypothetical protein